LKTSLVAEGNSQTNLAYMYRMTPSQTILMLQHLAVTGNML